MKVKKLFTIEWKKHDWEFYEDEYERDERVTDLFFQGFECGKDFDVSFVYE